MLVDLGRNDVGKVCVWTHSSSWRLESPFLLLRSLHPSRICSYWQVYACMKPRHRLSSVLLLCGISVRMLELSLKRFVHRFQRRVQWWLRS